MTDFVVDASIALAWCFADEATPATEAVFERMKAGSADVPVLFHLEVANALVIAERRGRIAAADIDAFHALLDGLALELDQEAPRLALGPVLDLARDHTLTVYDAAYLELAQRRGVPLASLDGRLRSAAGRLGIAVIPT